MLNRTTGNGAEKTIINTGSKMAAVIEDTEIQAVVRKHTLQLNIHKATGQRTPGSAAVSPSSTPALVATPFPPLKFIKHVQLCPHTAAIAAAIRPSTPGLSQPATTTTGTKPLSISMIRTAVPGFLPNTRKTFVAPIFPEPC